MSINPPCMIAGRPGCSKSDPPVRHTKIFSVLFPFFECETFYLIYRWYKISSSSQYAYIHMGITNRLPNSIHCKKSHRFNWIWWIRNFLLYCFWQPIESLDKSIAHKILVVFKVIWILILKLFILSLKILRSIKKLSAHLSSICNHKYKKHQRYPSTNT